VAVAVVAYTLKALGCSVTTNDFLAFPAVIAQATIANQGTRLTVADVERITGAPADSRDLIQRKFDGLYFTAEDRMFLDAAWSHIDGMGGNKRALAISALVLAAARKQPRGVFTFTDLRYDDGRRDLRLTLREHFAETAEAYNAVVFDSGRPGRAMCGDVFDLDTAGYDLVYLDPPYAPPRDDNCYIKRYHFLGRWCLLAGSWLAVWWPVVWSAMSGTRVLHLVGRPPRLPLGLASGRDIDAGRRRQVSVLVGGAARLGIRSAISAGSGSRSTMGSSRRR